MASSRVKHVVVDAIAFFKNVQLQEVAENVYTCHGVVNEIRDPATRQRLAVLPYNLKCREPSTEAIQTVSEFARKTGDYASLSAVDIKVLALAYQVTKEQLGEEPPLQQPDKQVSSSQRPSVKAPGVVGFVYPKSKETDDAKPDGKSQDEQLTDKLNQLNTADATSRNDGNVELTLTELETCNQAVKNQAESNTQTQGVNADDSNIDSQEDVDSVSRTCENEPVENTRQDSDEANKSVDDDQENEENDDEGIEEISGDEEEDGEDGWITPGNLKQAHKDMGGLDEEVADIVVGCMTTDFSMQNVLIQMGIPVLSVEGLHIKRAKSFILRCYGCFKTTSNTSKKFCPGCGNQTLTKVSVSVDDGTSSQHLHFSRHKVINKRGMKYSLPAPKGGKHSDNPHLVEDQPQPQNRLARKARIGTDVFDPDFVTNSSPFAVKDVTSRSAQLGVGHLSSRNTSHSRRNPNEVRRKKGNKK